MRPTGRGDDRNYHAHVMMSSRRLDADGFGAKIRVLDDRRTGPREIEHVRHRRTFRTGCSISSASSACRAKASTRRAWTGS